MMSGVSPCLLDLTTGGVDVRRPVVPVAVRSPAPMPVSADDVG